MTQVLKIAQFPKDQRMPKMNIGARRIDSQLDPQWAFRPQLFRQLGRGNDLDRAAAQFRKLLSWIHPQAHSKKGRRVKTKFICFCLTAHGLPRS